MKGEQRSHVWFDCKAEAVPCLVGRYVAKHPHYDPMHRSSEAYKAFQSQVLDQVEVASKDGQSYIEQDIGYM